MPIKLETVLSVSMCLTGILWYFFLWRLNPTPGYGFPFAVLRDHIHLTHCKW